MNAGFSGVANIENWGVAGHNPIKSLMDYFFNSCLRPYRMGCSLIGINSKLNPPNIAGMMQHPDHGNAFIIDQMEQHVGC